MNRSLAVCLLIVAAVILPAGCARAPQPPASATPGLQPVASQEVATPTPSTPPPTARPTESPTPEPTPTRTGRLIAIDPGHGGRDLGARHFNREGQMVFHESTITLAVALRLGAKLEALGYDVFYTRDGDYDPNMYERDVTGDGQITLRDVVQARTDLVIESDADLLLSIHFNAWEHQDDELVRRTGGIETYYCPDRPFGDENLRFAKLVHTKVLAAIRGYGYDLVDRGIRIDHAPAWPGDPGGHLMILGPVDDIIVRASQMPGVLSESMFITCDAEAELMQQEEVQDLLAQAYADAIVAFFEEQDKP